MRLVRLALLLALAAVFSSLGTSRAHAQAVRWEPSDADPSDLILVYENCQPDGAPRFPTIAGLELDRVIGGASWSYAAPKDSLASLVEPGTPRTLVHSTRCARRA